MDTLTHLALVRLDLFSKAWQLLILAFEFIDASKVLAVELLHAPELRNHFIVSNQTLFHLGSKVFRLVKTLTQRVENTAVVFKLSE